MITSSIKHWLQNYNEEQQWFSPCQGVIVLLKKHPLQSYHKEANHKVEHWQLQICIIDVDDELQNKGYASTFILNCLDFVKRNTEQPVPSNDENIYNCYVSLQINECQTERFCNFLKRIGGTVNLNPEKKHPDVVF